MKSGSWRTAFNEMLGHIETRESALQSAHVELEARVDERTRELQKTRLQSANRRSENSWNGNRS